MLTKNILERAGQKLQPAEGIEEGKRMRFTLEPVPDSRLPRLAPRARRAGGIRDGVCVCVYVAYILIILPPFLFSPSPLPLKTYAERVG